MNRQLLADSGVSLPDYDVLTALSVADDGRMPVTVLAAHIGWERSRVSHHVRRMSARGLVGPLSEANHRDSVMTSHMPGGKPGSVTADIRSLEMTKAQPRPGKANRRLHR